MRSREFRWKKKKKRKKWGRKEDETAKKVLFICAFVNFYLISFWKVDMWG